MEGGRDGVWRKREEAREWMEASVKESRAARAGPEPGRSWARLVGDPGLEEEIEGVNGGVYRSDSD